MYVIFRLIDHRSGIKQLYTINKIVPDFFSPETLECTDF